MLKDVLSWLYKQEYLNEEIIESSLLRKGLDFQLSPFSYGQVDGFVVDSLGAKAFLSERSVSYMNSRRVRVTTCQERAIQKNIPIPLFLGLGDLINQIHEVSSSDNKDADKWLIDLFTPAVASTYVLKYFENSQSLRPYIQIIYESLEAYYMELDHVAVMALLPVVEGGLRNVQEIVLSHTDANIKSEDFVARLGDMLVKHGEREASDISIYPGSFGSNEVRLDFLTHANPQCDVMNAFRIFFKKVLYRRSRDASDGFNRHLILHLLKNDFASPANFIRVFLLLSHIAFCERSSNSSIPMLWPGSDEDDMRVAKYFVELSTKVGEPRSRMWRPGAPLPPASGPDQD